MDELQKIKPIPSESEKITNIFTLEELFTIPLKAVIDANAYAAQTALDFIIKYGFNSGIQGLPDSNRFLGNLRMATFIYNYIDVHGKQQTTEISIPFISLIPIPMLEVKKAQFDYAIQILSQDYKEKITENGFTTNSTKKKSLLAIMAPIDTTKSESAKVELSNSFKANMAVRIEVEKSDLPAGILQLLNLGQESIKGKSEFPLVITTDPEVIHFGKSIKKEITVKIEKEIKDGRLEPQRNVEVQIEVTSTFDKITNLFTGAIKVEEGKIIGKPTIRKARAITTNAGAAKFLIEKNKEYNNNEANGFIVVKVTGALDKLIYFNFK